jgi:hypothetical protein
MGKWWIIEYLYRLESPVSFYTSHLVTSWGGQEEGLFGMRTSLKLEVLGEGVQWDMYGKMSDVRVLYREFFESHRFP